MILICRSVLKLCIRNGSDTAMSCAKSQNAWAYEKDIIVEQNFTRSEFKMSDIILQQPKRGPLARYLNLRVAHTRECRERFYPLARVSDPDMHHGTCVTHMPWCMSGSLTSGFLRFRWRGKRSRHSRRMRNPQFYVSGKSPMGCKPLHKFLVRDIMIWFILEEVVIMLHEANFV